MICVLAIENKIYLGSVIETHEQENLFNQKIIVGYGVDIGNKIVYTTQIYPIENINIFEVKRVSK